MNAYVYYDGAFSKTMPQESAGTKLKELRVFSSWRKLATVLNIEMMFRVKEEELLFLNEEEKRQAL